MGKCVIMLYLYYKGEYGSKDKRFWCSVSLRTGCSHPITLPFTPLYTDTDVALLRETPHRTGKNVAVLESWYTHVKTQHSNCSSVCVCVFSPRSTAKDFPQVLQGLCYES